ncbi:Cysteine protease ATG4A [Camelus dromedarius]|uniref:Cysteine protease n=1 Tax=Camelus dromedarius TaxID=9838 RepID=A0A5N4C301_CAMDR|nr:Cysteine protease ATG4A [Camelus dromedarius]
MLLCRKLALFDEWNSLAVYVSMDNTVVIEDIKKMCCTLTLSADTAAESAPDSLNASTQRRGPSACRPAWKPLLLIVPLRLGINQINPVYVDAFKECFKMPQSLGALGGKPNNAYYFIGFLGKKRGIIIKPSTKSQPYRNASFLCLLFLFKAFCHLILIVTKGGVRKTRAPPPKESSGTTAGGSSKVKLVSFKTGNELIFLDPHTTQTFVDTEENGTVDDQTFHCLQSPQRMNILNLDPSVALGFFCKEEKDFDSWCSLVQKEILKENLRMFELVQKHPSHWPPFVPPAKPEVTTTGAEFIDSTEQLEEFDLEEDFEILSI